MERISENDRKPILARNLTWLAWFACCVPTGSTVLAQEEASPRSLIVGTRNVPPFAMRSDDGTWSGVSISLWRSIADDLKIEPTFKEFPDVGSLLDAVESSTVDIGVAAITVNAEREERIDFTMPYYTSGIGVAVPKTNRSFVSSFFALVLQSRTLVLAALLIALLFVVGALAWWLERNRNKEDFDRRPLRGIWDGVWFAAVTMTTVGYGDKSPKTFLGRLLALTWMFAGLVLISLFTAAAVSALTELGMHPRIQRSDDLLRYRCGTVGDSTSAEFLISENIGFLRYPSIGDAIEAMLAGEIDVGIYDAPSLRYYSYTEVGGTIEVLPVRFQQSYYAFALPEGSPLREPINRRLLDAIESDGWRQHVAKLLGK